MAYFNLPPTLPITLPIISGSPNGAAGGFETGRYLRRRQEFNFARIFDERLAYRRIPKKYVVESVIFTAYHFPLDLPLKYFVLDFNDLFPYYKPKWIEITSFNPHTTRFMFVMAQIAQREKELREEYAESSEEVFEGIAGIGDCVQERSFCRDRRYKLG
ncbi:hypothetical protein IAR50_002230 [Cryptococcus sp. DSM 104548]